LNSRFANFLNVSGNCGFGSDFVRIPCVFVSVMGRNEPKDDRDEEAEIKAKARTAYDVQRHRLEKLMKDPAKPAFIPEPRKEKDVNKAPDFVYNVMGSSAGAGSGEFHVYRQIRRKEYERQKVLDVRKTKDDLDEAFQIKREENAKAAADKTAKKRAKRLKKKANAKKAKQSKAATKGSTDTKKDDSDSESDKSDNEEDDDKKNEDKNADAQDRTDEKEQASS